MRISIQILDKWNTLRPTRPTDSLIVSENAAMTFTVGFNQFDSLSESLSLRDWSKPGICLRSKAIIASGELQVSSLRSSGLLCGPSADAQRRSLECGLGGRLGVRRCLVYLSIAYIVHPSSGPHRSTCYRPSVNYTLPPLPSAKTQSRIPRKHTELAPHAIRPRPPMLQQQPLREESPRSHSSSSKTSGSVGPPVHGSLQRAREPYPPTQLTSPAGPTGFARRCSAPAPASTYHNTPLRIRTTRLHYTPPRPLLILYATRSQAPRARNSLKANGRDRPARQSGAVGALSWCSAA
jgi:hypothetical protein